MWYLITYVFGGATYSLSTENYQAAKETCIALRANDISDIHCYKVSGEIRWEGMKLSEEVK